MQFKSYIVVAAIGSALLLGAACQSDNKTDNMESSSTPAKPISVPAFNRDSAYNYVAKQVAFGPRVTNSEAHAACRQWLVAQFKAFGATVIEQNFKATAYTGVKLNGTNIIAQYNPGNKNRIVLAAHWDSRPFADSPLSKERRDEPVLGADDGASGVGVLLEIARQLQANPVDFGVDLVLFDAEDYGESKEEYANEEEQRRGLLSWALGSQHWSRNLHVAGYSPKYGILLDMVGSKGARFTYEAYSMRFAPEVVNKVWALAANMGYSNYFIAEDGGGVTDDHYFVNTIAGIPMIDIINRPVQSETGFGHYWHTHNDNMDVIDRQTLHAVGQVLLAIIYREAAGTI